jgi:hypothetical protein
MPRVESSRFVLRSGMAVVLLAACFFGCEDDEQRSCESLGDEATTRRGEIERAAENRACSSDADCVFAYHPLSCFADCGEPAAISRVMEEHVATEVAAVEADLCGQHERRDCPPPIELPCLPPLGTWRAVCQNERCTLQAPLLE